MNRIKRTKSVSPLSTASIHWAVKLDPSGCVVLWTTDRDAAGLFDDLTALKVEDRYAAKAKRGETVGLVVVESDAPPKPVELPPAVPIPAPVPKPKPVPVPKSVASPAVKPAPEG